MVYNPVSFPICEGSFFPRPVQMNPDSKARDWAPLFPPVFLTFFGGWEWGRFFSPRFLRSASQDFVFFQTNPLLFLQGYPNSWKSPPNFFFCKPFCKGLAFPWPEFLLLHTFFFSSHPIWGNFPTLSFENRVLSSFLDSSSLLRGHPLVVFAVTQLSWFSWSRAFPQTLPLFSPKIATWILFSSCCRLFSSLPVFVFILFFPPVFLSKTSFMFLHLVFTFLPNDGGPFTSLIFQICLYYVSLPFSAGRSHIPFHGWCGGISPIQNVKVTRVTCHTSNPPGSIHLTQCTAFRDHLHDWYYPLFFQILFPLRPLRHHI